MFKILMLFIYITLLIVIIVFNPGRVVRYTLPCIFVITGGIYTFIANIIGNRCMAAVSNRYLGRTVFIDTQIAYRVMGVMYVYTGSSFLCYYFDIWNGCEKQEKKNIEISEINV